MSEVDEIIELNERKTLGKGLGILRSQGQIPGVIHDHGKASIYVQADGVKLEKLYKIAGKHHPLQLKVGTKEYFALIKDAHFNPVKRHLQHLVFQAIKRDEKVEAEIPIRLDGDIPAEKAGLLVLHQLDSVQIEALPQDLPDELIADAGKLVELHDKIVVGDLVVPSGVTILTESDHPIAVVVETRAQISEEAEAAEEAGEAETEDGESTEGSDKKDGETPANE